MSRCGKVPDRLGELYVGQSRLFLKNSMLAEVNQGADLGFDKLFRSGKNCGRLQV